MKLNLGYGEFKLSDYENIDLKDGRQAYPLDIADSSCDEIRVSHLLEHFSHRIAFEVIKHWVTKLKPNGILKIAVPDFQKIAKNYLNQEKQNTCGYIMGAQADENDYHKSIFDESSLAALLKAAGLIEIEKWNDEQDTCRLPISLNLQGKKPEMQTIKKTVRCVMSTPRLSFTSNANCMIRELAMRGIEVTLGTGAYWHQVLTNIIEQELEHKSDYILTLDYDTWFTFDHVKKMMELMELSDADVIVSMQVKREEDSLLLQTNQNQISKEQYDSGLLPITSGHFGCTLFRSECFNKLKKPWFLPVPGDDGRWADGRLDADIYFWKNCIEMGLKVYLATQVKIGHVQLMATFPGTFENGFKPVQCYLNDVENKKIPEYIMKGLRNED